jgi:signal transduction histidine kinase
MPANQALNHLRELAVDKHKVLQILVNIIGNAKHACHDADHKDRTNEIFVRIRTSDQRVRISVSDNGIGILPENLTKIFNHGFTTRKDGHGFGLHSGALAAREMGGSLTATSAGANQGATFTLELPLVPANGAPIEPKSLAKNSHAMNAQGV